MELCPIEIFNLYIVEKTAVTPVVVIREEKEKTHKTWYMTLYYETLFGGKQRT